MTDTKAAGADAYKDSVFLPKTDFPMRGELPKKEPEILQQWQEMDLYARQREMSKGRTPWILHWGPPYANGNAHIGHAFTKSLKDVVNRSWQMMGYDAPLVPGWDCHGLPIEWKIEEKYRAQGKNKDDIDIITFRAECREFAGHWAKTQSEEFQRLGVLADWKDPYLTMTFPAEAQITREIHKFLLNGSLYRGVKPVMWSTVEKTALAEAEVEYKEHKSITVWVKFPITSTQIADAKEASIVIWTTTPWTLPSNRAIAFGEKIDYAVYEVTGIDDGSKAKIGEKIILARSLADTVKAQAKITDWTEMATVKGSAFAGTIAAHPLHAQGYDYAIPMLAGDFVTEDAGTGFVHIAPSHGEDDYWLYMRHFGARDIPDNVSDDGKYRDHVPLFAGMEVLTGKGEMGNGNFAVLKALDEAGGLLAKGSIKHDYPHSWRSGAPVIFRTTPQWFIAMDDQNNLRQVALNEIAKTRWIPAQGENRIRSMVEQRPDWCISRQRSWGVPIALFLDKTTGEPLADKTVLSHITDTFEKEGADAWWARPAQYFLGGAYKAEDYDQVFDIVDVWFESGSTYSFVLEARGLPTPADLYLEGSDQHRGWFQSSLLESCGTRGHAPFKNVMTHGFLLDEKGYKMSKSQGNGIPPEDVWNKHGADILRLWAMTVDYTEDAPIGENILKATGDTYRRLRNTFRYLLGALDGFTTDEKIQPKDYKKMPELEQLVLHWLSELDKEIRTHIQNYEFGKIIHLLHNFCTNRLSSLYFDIRKDRLYCDRPDLFERRATRTVMAHLFECLTAWLAPYLCFTTEEAWILRPEKVFEDCQSVHLRNFTKIPDEWDNEKLLKKWTAILAVRYSVLAELELNRAAKIIGSSLEASPILIIPKENHSFWKDISPALMAEICITSSFSIDLSEKSANTVEIDEHIKTESYRPYVVEFAKAEGQKCQRCWKILPDVGSDAEYPDLSARDADAVRWYTNNKKAA